MFNRRTDTMQSVEGTRLLRPEEVELVTGGRMGGGGEVVIVDCTTRPPVGGYPPGTIVWNPWINPHGPFGGGL